MSYVILKDIIQTVLETLECFLSNTNNNMHILATETEKQAIYFRQLIHPSYSILPPSHKKLKLQGVVTSTAGPLRYKAVCVHQQG